MRHRKLKNKRRERKKNEEEEEGGEHGNDYLRLDALELAHKLFHLASPSLLLVLAAAAAPFSRHLFGIMKLSLWRFLVETREKEKNKRN